MTEIATCLWFTREAEEAAGFYTALLPGSIDGVHRAPADYPAGKAGDVLTVDFTLCGARYVGLNGGESEAHTWAASIMVTCEDQAEVDRLWSALLADGGKENACGWLADRWGVPWQIVPRRLTELMTGPDTERAKRVMQVMMTQGKLDIAALEAA